MEELSAFIKSKCSPQARFCRSNQLLDVLFHILFGLILKFSDRAANSQFGSQIKNILEYDEITNLEYIFIPLLFIAISVHMINSKILSLIIFKNQEYKIFSLYFLLDSLSMLK